MDNAARKIAFVSPHCVLDFTNGAATATLDALTMLTRSRLQCEAFCNTRVDAWEEVLVEEILAKRGVPYQVRNAQIGRFRGRMIFTSHGGKGDSPTIAASRTLTPALSRSERETDGSQSALTPSPSPGHPRSGSWRGDNLPSPQPSPGGRGGPCVPVTLFNSASTRGAWAGPEEIGAFLTGCEIFLRRNRPDLVWTYGGDEVSVAVQRVAKQLGIPVFFYLHNFGYFDRGPFEAVDCIAVPSEFSRAYYRRSLGLECEVLPYVIDPGRVSVRSTGFSRKSTDLPPEGGTTNFVTFVNPQPAKGLYVVARIADVLSVRRPDIPLLVIEGRNAAGWQQATGIDLARLGNITVRPNTTDVRTFYAVSKMVLVPSLWNESFGLVAAEAMFNGIPVLASNRGGLPETIGTRPHPGPLPEGEGDHSSRPGALDEGEGGFLFDIPARYTPETRDVPTTTNIRCPLLMVFARGCGGDRRRLGSQSIGFLTAISGHVRIEDVSGDQNSYHSVPHPRSAEYARRAISIPSLIQEETTQW